LKTAFFSRSYCLPDLKVKENVLEQAFPFLNQIKEVRESSFVNLSVGEVGFQDAALFIRKDFAYHTSESSGRNIKLFPKTEKVIVQFLVFSSSSKV
jgi:hypothetical protein